MSIAITFCKRLIVSLNVIFLFLGVATIYINATNLEDSNPGTDAHTFYIMGILLCSLLCLTVIIGCYGVTSEVLGMNIIYSLFVLSLLIIQYLQLRSLQELGNDFSALKRVENAWRLVDYRPDIMQFYETNYQCCALFNAHDYINKHLSIPDSCYERNDLAKDLSLWKIGCLEALNDFYHSKLFAQSILNWSLIISEAMAFIFTVILCMLQCRRLHSRYRSRDESEEQHNAENHISSQTPLIAP